MTAPLLFAALVCAFVLAVAGYAGVRGLVRSLRWSSFVADMLARRDRFPCVRFPEGR